MISAKIRSSRRTRSGLPRISKGLAASPGSLPHSGILNHIEVVQRKRRVVGQQRKLNSRVGAIAVSVIGQDAGRLIVEDVVIGLECGGSLAEVGGI